MQHGSQHTLRTCFHYPVFGDLVTDHVSSVLTDTVDLLEGLRVRNLQPTEDLEIGGARVFGDLAVKGTRRSAH